ncbi:MAG TPA: penicillin acylase family protein [Xanthomonadales bacterium]|nr:penicillin acylase family protein [Xanthomonadales bacterium]
MLEGRNQDWCATVGAEESTPCADIVRESLAIAAAKLEAQLGPRPEDWRWDRVTAIEHPHQVFAGLPILDSMFSRIFNYPGGPDTLMIQYADAANAPHFTQARFCSSYQAIYDLADLESSQFMLSTGQSGHFKSPFYDNFLAPFAAGERFTIPTDPNAINVLARLELTAAEYLASE